MKRVFIILFAMFIGFGGNAATLINDTEIESGIAKIVAPVAKVANIPTDRLKVYIVRDDNFNAFVRGGEEDRKSVV